MLKFCPQIEFDLFLSAGFVGLLKVGGRDGSDVFFLFFKWNDRSTGGIWLAFFKMWYSFGTELVNKVGLVRLNDLWCVHIYFESIKYQQIQREEWWMEKSIDEAGVVGWGKINKNITYLNSVAFHHSQVLRPTIYGRK